MTPSKGGVTRPGTDRVTTTMPIRTLYIARHGDADPFGELTDISRRQASILGERLAHLPINSIWHSALPRAASSTQEIARYLPPTPVAESAELIDNVPCVTTPAETPPSWVSLFDGYAPDEADAAAGNTIAQGLITRFATTPDPAHHSGDSHELLITHAYPTA